MNNAQDEAAEKSYPTNTKKCGACGESINANARLCYHCKSYQSSWRNELQYWAKVAGLVTLIATGFAFTANLGHEIWQRLFGHEVALTNLDPFGTTTAWNLTSGAISLSTVNITSTSPQENLVWEVHETIPSHKQLQIYLRKIAECSWYGFPGQMFGSKPGAYAPLDRVVFNELKRNKHTDKYVPTFLMPDSESFTQLKAVMQGQSQTFDCKATITYLRLSDGSTGSIDVPCEGTFRFRGPARELTCPGSQDRS